MAYVEETVLKSLEKKCQDEIEELKIAVKSYRKNSARIDSVISVLKKYYNTESGNITTNKIAKIDFSQDSFLRLLNNVANFNCNYNTYKEDV